MKSLLLRIVHHPAYILLVVLVIQPINGSLIERGDYVVGIALIAMQVLWAISLCIAVKVNN